jgi:hypothetical protein
MVKNVCFNDWISTESCPCGGPIFKYHNVSKNTFVVLVKDLEEDTGKANDARKIGVPLITPDGFKKKYGI